MHDVFLSHSSSDKDWVENLKNALHHYEIDAWLDKDEIRPGEHFGEALEVALEHSNNIVLVVTKKSLSSGWVKEEYYRALSLATDTTKDIELIPVIKNKVKMPGFLADRNYVDFTDPAKYNESVWKLAWGISKKKPDNVIDIQNNQASLARTVKNQTSTISKTINRFPAGTNKIIETLLDSVLRLVALHGVDDATWAKAISSQYFLVGVSRNLKLTDQEDYKRLLNKFLSSFHHQIDETLILEKNHILVTPEELKKIVECMRIEDEKDGYFSRSVKTKWDSIDAWKLHYNYLYGLAVEISNDDKYRVLNNIQSLSIDELIYGQSQTQLDDHGGWYPYRIPWITARILIGLKHSSIDTRDDISHINGIIEKALESILRRVYEGKYWKSGVGEWVSDWESTALCLEALNEWNYIENNIEKVSKIIKYVLENEEDWLVDPPNFSNEEDSNLTLASVLMVCIVLQISQEHTFCQDLFVDTGNYLKYLHKVMSAVDSTEKQSSRQFCTIPQIAYYIVKTVH